MNTLMILLKIILFLSSITCTSIILTEELTIKDKSFWVLLLVVGCIIFTITVGMTALQALMIMAKYYNP